MVFDVLFNLHKFIRFESRDPFQDKLRREDSFGSDWNRYACAEYHRLAAEEEGYDAQAYGGVGSMDIDDGEGKMGGTLAGVDDGDGDGWFLDDDDDDLSTVVKGKQQEVTSKQNSSVSSSDRARSSRR